MTGKQLMIALSTAVALAIAGAGVAQASDNNSGDYKGGYRIGPLGQRFGTGRGPAFRSFAYAPGWHWHYTHRRYWY